MSDPIPSHNSSETLENIITDLKTERDIWKAHAETMETKFATLFSESKLLITQIRNEQDRWIAAEAERDRLQTDNDRLKSERDFAKEQWIAVEKHRDRIKIEYKQLGNQKDRAITELMADNERLREALRDIIKRQSAESLGIAKAALTESEGECTL